MNNTLFESIVFIQTVPSEILINTKCNEYYKLFTKTNINKLNEIFYNISKFVYKTRKIRSQDDLIINKNKFYFNDDTNISCYTKILNIIENKVKLKKVYVSQDNFKTNDFLKLKEYYIKKCINKKEIDNIFYNFNYELKYIFNDKLFYESSKTIKIDIREIKTNNKIFNKLYEEYVKTIHNVNN